MRKNDSPWIQTTTGQQFHYKDIVPEQFNITDISSGLSRTCRWSGQLKDTPELEDSIYSVAQHSVYVLRFMKEMAAPADSLYWGLMHDAPEAYFVDLPSPLKQLLPTYAALEDACAEALRERFNIPYNEDIRRCAKNADMHLMWMESDVLCEISHDAWDTPGTTVMSIEDLDPYFYLWGPKKARKEFLTAFDEMQIYGVHYANAS